MIAMPLAYWAVGNQYVDFTQVEDCDHEEVHYLVFEDGAWRIRGNVGESPRVLPFGTAPHPLF